MLSSKDLVGYTILSHTRVLLLQEGLSRVSWAYEFIRAQLCLLSDNPPASYICNEVTTAPTTSPSISPSDFPSHTPSDSPSESVPNPGNEFVRIDIRFDSYHQDNVIRLQDENATTIYEYIGTDDEINPGALTVIKKLEIGKTYTLTVTDSYGDGRE